MELGLRIAVGILLAAKGTSAMVSAGPEGMRFGSNIEIELENIGLQNMVPGTLAAEVIRPGSGLTGLYMRPEDPIDCCTRSLASGYRLALLLLQRACQPPHYSLAR